MSLNRFAKKRDANEAAIISAYRAHGLSVETIDTPCDLIIGWGDVSYLREVKNGKRGRLTPSQVKFRETWKGNYKIINSVEDAVADAVSIKGKLSRLK